MDEHPGCAGCCDRLRNCHRRCETPKNLCQMNRKQLVILLVLVALLGGAGLLMVKNQNASWKETNPAMGKKVLGDFPVNDVAHIVLKHGTNEVNLAKTDVWRVRERNNYPANYSEISDFLLKIRELKIV